MTSPAPIAWIVPAGTKITSPGDTARHTTRFEIEPSSTACTQLLRSQTLIQAEGDLGFGSGTQDVPGFGFAVRQAHRMRKRIVRMNLDGKRLAREQQLEQERRICGRPAGSLVPDFADRAAVMARVTPRTQIYDTPRLW